MTIRTNYPRVLLVAIGRVNAADAANNGLLLRNLFGPWPKSQTAQIFSGSDNGDEGFFGRYYRLGRHDRRLGWLFNRIKAEAQSTLANTSVLTSPVETEAGRLPGWMRTVGQRLLMDTGLYELIFKINISAVMRSWLDDFRPQLIFAQGYTLGFTQLPMLLADYCRAPIIYYPTDDWADCRYNHNLPTVLSWLLSRLPRRVVVSESRRLVEESTICLSFNRFMKEKFHKRYGKDFIMLMHGDDATRFESVNPRRLAKPDEHWIVCAGDFDHYRWPLLSDLDAACEILNAKGLRVRATVFPVNPVSESTRQACGFRHVNFEPCPSHAGLAAVLRGADILFLAERFGPTAELIRLSVSSKAHLYMFSGRPIVVYSDPITGIARYASEEGWAAVVYQRDPNILALTFEGLIRNESERHRLIETARCVAMKNHHLSSIQQIFQDIVCSAML